MLRTAVIPGLTKNPVKCLVVQQGVTEALGLGVGKVVWGRLKHLPVDKGPLLKWRMRLPQLERGIGIMICSTCFGPAPRLQEVEIPSRTKP